MHLFNHLAPLFLHNRLTEISFFVTSICNFRCKHCYMLDKLNKRHAEMTIEEIEKTGQFIPRLQRVHIGGGEPLMRSDIAQIVRTIALKWNAEVICLPTNGSLTQRAIEVAESFSTIKGKRLRFHFSLNSEKERYDQFTGFENSFDTWLETIKAVKKISEKSNSVELVVLMTYNDFNQDKFEEMMHFVLNDVGIDDLSIGLVRKHKNYQPNIDILKYEEIVEKYFRNQSIQNPFLRAYREEIRKNLSLYFQKQSFITRCFSGKVRIVISPEGNVYPCECLGYPEGEFPEEWLLGNLRDYDYNLQFLLKNDKSSSVRKRIKTSKCHCHQGIDLSLSLLCNNAFKFRVFAKGLGLLWAEN